MSEQYFRRLRTIFIVLILLFVLAQLLWEHMNGGVSSHHLLRRSDLPAISNWWGVIILPFLAWVSTVRVKKRMSFQSSASSAGGEIPKGVLLGFFGMLFVSLLQTIAFVTNYEDITKYLALGVLLIGLVLPIYRAECILGYVMGAVFTFGAVIPLIGMLFIAVISALSNLCIKPLLGKVWAYSKTSGFVQRGDKT